MSVSESVYERIFDDQLLNKLIDDLTYNQFFQEKQLSQPLIQVSFEEIKKSIWLCSILAGSAKEEHRKKVQLFACLSVLQNRSNIDIERACFLLLSRVGNLTATRLFENFPKLGQNTETSVYSFDALLELELASEWNDKLINIGSEDILASRFQKDLWNNLKSGEKISISAPTSAGKSFILKKYVNSKLSKKDTFKVLYIVPSKALINQVSEEFRKEVNLKEIDVKTAFLEEEIGKYKKKEIYVLTPERCLRLIQQALKQEELKLDLIFVDEIQNVEDEDGRGSLLEYVLKELHSIFTNAQLIIAGPNINNTSVLFNRLFGENAKAVETGVSPVFQIKTVIRPIEGKKLKITLKNISGREQSFEVTTDIDFQKLINKSYAKGIAPIVDFFSSNEQNIIYSPRTDYVESWTLQYINESGKVIPKQEKETQELIEFLQEEIHPKYYLIKCLEKKAAFHHSKLPDIVRKEIEDGYLEKRITNLFCTSTLLEGINLPANNLFIVSPKKLNEELSPFEFGNLIGRAGRIKDSLYGTIYCIERDSNDSWAEEYYDKVYQKDVQSVTDKALSEPDTLLIELDKPINEIEEPKHSNTVVFLRHKFLNNAESLKEYLSNKNINSENIQRVLEKLSASLSEISIPSEVTRLNPSIDPIQQNQLYKEILREGIEQWAITPNENFNRGISKENKDNYTFQNTSLFWQLVSIMERLDKIFSISLEAYFKHSISTSIRQICFYGLRWLNSVSYSALIKGDINFYANHSNPDKRINPEDEEAINVRINEVIKINSTLVSYVLVKYLKLTNDIIEPLMSEEQKEKYKFSLGLPTMLELGSSETTVKLLISRGVSRSVALKIWQEFKKVNGYEQIDVFEWLRSFDKLNLKSIYNRYLQRMHLLKQD